MKQKMNAQQMRDEINRLRAAAGLPQRTNLHGTSLMALRVILNAAERGQFN